mgnify:CR=1 FL=1
MEKQYGAMAPQMVEMEKLAQNRSYRYISCSYRRSNYIDLTIMVVATI